MEEYLTLDVITCGGADEAATSSSSSSPTPGQWQEARPQPTSVMLDLKTRLETS
jgi:hypothetical protein